SLRLERDRMGSTKDQSRRHRARGSVDVRVRRRAGGPDCRRALREPRCARPARGRARYARRVLSRPRGSHSSTVERCAEGDPRDRQILRSFRLKAEVTNVETVQAARRLDDAVASAFRLRAKRFRETAAALAKAVRRKFSLVIVLATTGGIHSGARDRIAVLRSIGGLPAHVAGAFRTPLAFQQADDGRYFVFDRRAHAVYTITGDDPPRKIIEVGQEQGRVLDPSAFDIDPADGTFVIADAPAGRQRVQTFTASGSQLGGFTLPGREVPRLTLGPLVLNGVGSLQFTGRSVLLNQPERGALVTELAFDGSTVRAFGELRATGHEADSDLHLAFNAGLPLIDPTGGCYFGFQAGSPVVRK